MKNKILVIEDDLSLIHIQMCIRDRYPEITKENIHGILQKEIGIVFTHVLEDAGVYKCTTEGREAFMRFLETL